MAMRKMGRASQRMGNISRVEAPARATASPYALDRLPDLGPQEWAWLKGQRIFFDGVLKGDYSLAIVNRYLLRAMLQAGLNVVAHTPEQDWQTDRLLNSMPDVRRILIESYPARGEFDIHFRNTWPPETGDMVGAFNAYICFAWEETALPLFIKDRFEKSLDLVLTTSNFVTDVFRAAGMKTVIETVGNGCSHLETEGTETKPEKAPGERKRLLHVSSCFPRKGADFMLESVFRAAQSRSDLELVIKTFANEHNNLPQLIEDCKRRYPGADLPIEIIEAHLGFEDLNQLYRSADLFISATRGEGFGLPFAEAMLHDVPVVVTGFSGQVDFCTEETAYVADYSLEKATAHVSSDAGMWAKPSVESFTQQILDALNDPVEALERTRNGACLLREHMSWNDVVLRVAKALIQNKKRDSVFANAAAAPAVDWSMDLVSTWAQRCGIATYSEALYGCDAFTNRMARILARREPDLKDGPSPVPVERPWAYSFDGIERLGRALSSPKGNVLWVQHHPGFFSADDMRFLTARIEGYDLRVATLHNTQELAQTSQLDWTRAFDTVFVHSSGDAEILSANGHPRPVVIEHGIEPLLAPRKAENDTFTIGSFGFLFPHKNIAKLLEAFARVWSVDRHARLKLLTCSPISQASLETRSLILTLIKEMGLEEVVDFNYDFLDSEYVTKELSSCDLLVFAYGASSETASGAARIGIRANVPMICSKSNVLTDLAAVSHIVPDTEVDTLTDAILSLRAQPHLLSLRDADREVFHAWQSYALAAERYVYEVEKQLQLRNQ